LLPAMPQGKLKKLPGKLQGKKIAKKNTPKPRKNSDAEKLRKKFTAQLHQKIETAIAHKAASAGAKLKLVKPPEEKKTKKERKAAARK